MISLGTTNDANGMDGYTAGYSMTARDVYALESWKSRFVPGVDVSLLIPWELATNASFRVRWIGFLPYQLSESELEPVRDMIALKHGFNR